MSPALGLRHQTVGLRLYRLLDDACPDDLYVFAAPFAVQTTVSNEVQPDVLVARFDELTDKNLPTAYWSSNWMPMVGMRKWPG